MAPLLLPRVCRWAVWSILCTVLGLPEADAGEAPKAGFTPENWMVPQEVALQPDPLKAAVTIPQARIESEQVDPPGARRVTFIRLPHTGLP